MSRDSVVTRTVSNKDGREVIVTLAKRKIMNWHLLISEAGAFPEEYWRRKGRITLPRLKALRKWLKINEVEDMFLSVLDVMMELR